MSLTENYSLLEEPWIPVLWANGKPGRVGIKEALTQAGHIRQIAASNPMDRVAILRLLLALLYWCKGNPATDGDASYRESLPPTWFLKLDGSEECFNLLGEGKRFYQYRKDGDKPLAANYLIHEIPTGTNLWHFRHSTDEVDGLCPACCAMGLLRLPLFSTSGGRGKPPGINAKPPIYIIPMGESLAATLRLSWRVAPNLGTPAWVQPDIQLPKTGEVPLLTGLTWLPRRVWLGNQEEGEANCISCGCKERLILSTVFAPIGSTKTDEGGPSRIWRDPHVIYEQDSKGDVTSLHARDALGASDAAAGQWARIMAGIIPEHKALDNRGCAWAGGFATVQNDKYLEAMEYVIPCPSNPSEIQESIDMLERWQKEGTSLVRRARPPNEKAASRRQHKEIPPAVAAVRPDVEARVSAKVGELLAGGDAAWEEAAREYRPMMEMIAKSLSPGFTTAAVQRRRHIASVAPDMRPRTGSEKKLGEKKGGDK